MKAFAFALLLIAATGIADDQPPAAAPDSFDILGPRRAAKEDAPPQKNITPIPPRAAATSRYFICPKDETVVRVGRGTPPAGELLCPVDGTKMKAGAGPANSIFLLQ